eukprot:TRINITY_DN6882_c0_g1_i4.p1 TRINITY_DN6882_c0_g1~~TRINITY_DN6882_c0_g1_i4.p1  ORF type:complete len:331 (-),score=28.92 TRINITY_DN6882_c0_g1_i4:277-1269(-)
MDLCRLARTTVRRFSYCLYRFPRKSPSPTASPTINLPSRSDCQWIQALPGDTNKAQLLLEANSQIAELTRRQITITVEKELLEEEMHQWRERVAQLENRLMEAEESAAEKEELLVQLESKLKMLQTQSQLYMAGSQQRRDGQLCTQHDCHHHPTTSDISLSYQSGASSLLKQVGRIGEDVVHKVYPPLENNALEQLLKDKKPLTSASNSQDVNPKGCTSSDPSISQTKDSAPVSGYVLSMLWSGNSATCIKSFTHKLFSIVREVIFSDKFSAFWDWFLMVIFPLLGYAGLSICITLLLAAVSFAWRRALSGKLVEWFLQNRKNAQTTENA